MSEGELQGNTMISMDFGFEAGVEGLLKALMNGLQVYELIGIHDHLVPRDRPLTKRTHLFECCGHEIDRPSKRRSKKAIRELILEATNADSIQKPYKNP